MSEPIDSEFALALLENMPIGALLLDNNCVIWANPALAKLFASPVNKLIGLQAEHCDNSELAPLFNQSEQFSLSLTDGNIRWIKREIFSLDKTSQQIQLFTDVSRLVQLENEHKKILERLDELEIKDSTTGLLNRKSILHSLETQVSRSRRYENPLSLLRLTLVSDQSSDEFLTILRGISQILKDQLRWADQIGILDENTFLIILPETSLPDAKELATKLANDRTTLGEKKSTWNIRFGAATWQKGDDPGKLLNRLQVDQELNSVALLS